LPDYFIDPLFSLDVFRRYPKSYYFWGPDASPAGNDFSTSSGKLNVTFWRPSARLSVPFFLTIIGRAAHTQRNSPGGSTRRGQGAFPSDYYENGHTCLFISNSESFRYFWGRKVIRFPTAQIFGNECPCL